MMKKITLVSAALFLLLIVTDSCKKKSNVTPTNNILNDNAQILDTNSISVVTDSTFTISKSASTSLQVGQIILAAPTIANPYGMLRKIISITNVGSNVVCVTEQSNLNDAFKQLNLDTTFVISDVQSANYRKTSGALTINFDNNSSIINGVVLNGAITINIPSVQIQYKKSLGSSEPSSVIVEASINTNGSSLEIIKSASTTPVTIADEIALSTFNLTPLTIVVPILGVPFPIVFTQKIIINTLPITISGMAKWTITPVITATLGCKYEGGSWQNLCSFSNNAASQPLLQSDFSAGVSANFTFFNPRYEIAPYGLDILQGFFEVPNSINFTVSTSSPNYSLNYTLDVTGGIQTQFWDGNPNTYSITGTVINKTLLQGNWPTSTGLTIGQSYGGGVIAYILVSGDPGYSATTPHGLIAATSDQSTGIQWYNGSYTTTGATGTAIGTGLSNTLAIIANQGAGSYAATICNSYTGGGYTDWYLPSKDELNKLFINKGAIGGFASASYWSSSEDGTGNAWIQVFVSGSQNLFNKFNASYVRAVRAF